MKYRKKPVIIDAFRIGYDKVMPDWFMDRVTANVITLHCDNEDTRDAFDPCINLWAYIETIEGTMKASNGDYVIRGINGECYPCKPEIFNRTYEKVSEDEH